MSDEPDTKPNDDTPAGVLDGDREELELRERMTLLEARQQRTAQIVTLLALAGLALTILVYAQGRRR